jgi:RHS repeat-associated protein
VYLARVYSYDAYGNAHGFSPANAATKLLFSGEFYDSTAAQYYLRARWYSPATGRFNRTDPFAGNNRDPQSLHKYLYAHCNPINGIDPTGMMELNIGAVLRNVNIMSVLKASAIGGVWGAGINVTAGLIMRGGEITVNQFLWDACTGFALGALSGGTASLFNQIGVGLAKQFLGRLGWQLGLRLTLSFGTYSMSAMYDTLYDAWVIKREDGRWPSGKKFWGLYKINLAINCTIGFAVDAVKISGDTLMRNIDGDFSSASSRKRARMKYNALTKDQKQIERGINKVLKAAGGSSWTATISTLSANVTQKIAQEEWDGEFNLDD